MKKIILVCLLICISIMLFADVKTNIIDYLEYNNIPKWLIVILISMLPIFELRGGIPVAINLFDMNIFLSYGLCVLGNMIPVIPILIFLKKIYKLFSKWKFTKKLFDSFFERTRSKSEQIEKYKMLGLIAFVAIPLPVTGAWTGSVAAVLFNIELKHSILSILAGVLIAGVIVTLLSVMGFWGALIAGIVLIVSAIASIMRSRI